MTVTIDAFAFYEVPSGPWGEKLRFTSDELVSRMKVLPRTIDSAALVVVAGWPLRRVLAWSIFCLFPALATSAGAATPMSNVVATVHPADRPVCKHGYKLRGGSLCVPLVVPANAHIDQSGHDWECDRDYHKNGRACVRNSGVPQSTPPGQLEEG